MLNIPGPPRLECFLLAFIYIYNLYIYIRKILQSIASLGLLGKGFLQLEAEDKQAVETAHAAATVEAGSFYGRFGGWKRHWNESIDESILKVFFSSNPFTGQGVFLKKNPSVPMFFFFPFSLNAQLVELLQATALASAVMDDDVEVEESNERVQGSLLVIAGPPKVPCGGFWLYLKTFIKHTFGGPGIRYASSIAEKETNTPERIRNTQSSRLFGCLAVFAFVFSNRKWGKKPKNNKKVL